MLDSEASAPLPAKGKELRGQVSAIDPQHGLFIDLGLKQDGLLPHAELEKLQQEGQTFAEGQELTVTVVNPQGDEGRVIVTLRVKRARPEWEKARKLQESGEIWEGEIVGQNRGGLLVQFDGVQAFVPVSQISDLPRQMNDEEREQRLKGLIGKHSGFKVIEVDEKRRRLVLSQRQAQHEYREKQRASLMDDLAVGQVRQGVITALREFGAFVDLGGADGLVHISEVSWQRVRHPNEVLQVGQAVEVEVIKIDPATKRIGLSIKRRQAQPWARVTELFHPGETVNGVVTRLTNFGAFVDLGQGIEGLLHISQFNSGQPPAEGEVITVNILRVEPERQRVSLGLPGARPARRPAPRPADEYDSSED